MIARMYVSLSSYRNLDVSVSTGQPTLHVYTSSLPTAQTFLLSFLGTPICAVCMYLVLKLGMKC